MRWIGWTLATLPGLLAAAAAAGLWVERAERERRGREIEVYPLEGGRVRIDVKPHWGAAEAVVVDADDPRVPLPHEEAVKFSWRRDDSGPLERPETGVLRPEHHGRPLALVYAAPPEIRAALRVHPFGRPQPRPGALRDERGFAIVAAFWFVGCGIALGVRLWEDARIKRRLAEVLTK